MDARDNFKRTTLRLPQELYDKLEVATEGKRSLNTEIIERLERSIDTPKFVKTIELEKITKQIAEQVLDQFRKDGWTPPPVKFLPPDD